jgi:hypothetical protein
LMTLLAKLRASSFELLANFRQNWLTARSSQLEAEVKTFNYITTTTC